MSQKPKNHDSPLPKLPTHQSRKDIDPLIHPHFEIILHSGAKLLAKDITGYSDPFVVFRVGTETVKSQIKYQTLNPKWDEKLLLYSDSPICTLLIEVWDWDPFNKADFMGGTTINLKEMIRDQEYPYFHMPLGSEEGTLSFTVISRNMGKDIPEKLIALFGLEESGKSTFKKQFLLLNGDKPQEYEYRVVSGLIKLTNLVLGRLKDAKQQIRLEYAFYVELMKEAEKDIADPLNWIDNSYAFHFPGVSNGLISLWKDPGMMNTVHFIQKTENIPYCDNVDQLFDEKSLDRFRCGENLLFVKDDILSFGSYFCHDQPERFKGVSTLDSDCEHLLETIKKLGNLEKSFADYEVMSGKKLKHLTKFYLANASKFSSLERSDKEYKPTEFDVLALSGPSVGFLTDKRKEFHGSQVILAEAAGSSSTRRKWKDMIKSNRIYAAIYLIDMSQHNGTSPKSLARHKEDLEAIKVLGTSLRAGTPVILFFNKMDLFQKKVTDKTKYALALKKTVQEYRDAYSGDITHIYTQMGSCLNPKQIQKAIMGLVSMRDVFVDAKLYGKPLPLPGLLVIDTWKERCDRQAKMSKEDVEKEESEFRLESKGSQSVVVEREKCGLCTDQIALIELCTCHHKLCNDCYIMVSSSASCPICDTSFTEITNIFTGQTIKIE